MGNTRGSRGMMITHGAPEDWHCGLFWDWWTLRLLEIGERPDDPADDPHAQCYGTTHTFDGAYWPDRDEPERCAPKPRTTATFWVTADIAPSPHGQYARDDHAQRVLDELWDRWPPARDKSFVVTHGGVDGAVLKIVCTYTARGANSDDVRKRVVRAADRVGRFVVGKPVIIRK